MTTRQFEKIKTKWERGESLTRQEMEMVFDAMQKTIDWADSYNDSWGTFEVFDEDEGGRQ